jgi:LmbE family N-acetylglucosaminyl deacetylase
MSDFSLLACYSHPDDEQGISGTLAHYANQGVRTGLLCATRGELGEIADAALATPATLGRVREQELRRAAAVLRLQRLWFLGYRDSGMCGTVGNRDQRAFINADEQEALGKIVRVIRAFQPTVIITFDASGGYGHPDHLRIHELTTKAFVLAQDESHFSETGRPWVAQRLFYASLPRSSIKQLAAFAAETGLATNFAGMNLDQLGLSDELITHQIDVQAYAEQKRASLFQHRTQLKPGKALPQALVSTVQAWKGAEYHAMLAGFPLEHPAQPEPLFSASSSTQHPHHLPDSWGAVEHFVLAAGVPVSHASPEAGSDLFAGLNEYAKGAASLPVVSNVKQAATSA